MDSNTTLPLILASWAQVILPRECCDEFFVNFNFLHVPCLKIAVSKCLGYAIILGSTIVKVPQIIKIFQAKSGQGISILSVSFELFAISATWAYGAGQKFPFSAFGEAILLAIQTCLIAFLILVFSNRTVHGLAYVSTYVGCMACLLSPMAPMSLLAACQTSIIFVVSASKIIQARANYLNSSTGQLSVITALLLFLGAIARIFTSLQETGDMLVIASYLVSSFFNGVIFTQILYYWKGSTGQEKQDFNKGKKHK